MSKLVASATRVITRKGGVTSTSGWQVQAWDMFETVPEVQAFAGWISNAMTGATLFAGKRGPDNTIEKMPSGSRAADLVDSIAGGPDGQAELLGAMGTHLSVAGETWLVIIPDPQADSFADDRWIAVSNEEVKVQRGKIKVTIDGEEVEILEPSDGREPGANDPLAIRLWDPSPRRHMEATSPVRASLAVLTELQLLTASVAAIARSRITGRGVLLVPAGTRFPASPGVAEAEDSLLDVFIEVASTAIREPESAAATVPIVLEIPGDLIGGVKWLEFSSEIDSLAIQLREEAIRRFAAGADIPAEVLMGLGDMNHWGAWAVTAEALRLGVEPRLSLVCNALTQQWLRPLLEAEGDPDASEAMVWFDTSALRSSSNKAASALDAYDKGLINGEAARRELGFTEADAPATPATPAATPATDEDGAPPVSETESPPPMDLAASTMDHGALIAAVDGIVYAAIAAAGQKILRTPLCTRPYRSDARALVASAEVHTRHAPQGPDDIEAYRLLAGAWIRVPEVAARYGVDAEWLTASLDQYATTLLLSGVSHTYDNTVRMLAQSGIIPSTLIGMVRT